MYEARLLIVQDDRATRTRISIALAQQGFRVDHSTCGEEALSARHADVDAILLDLNLPDMPGLEVLAALRSAPATADIPVLMMTGDPRSGGLVEAFRMGAVDYVRQPFHLDELIARVRTAIELTRHLNALREEVAELRHQALTDSLTGLENRRAAERHLERLIARSERSGRSLGVLLIDIDRFKLLNDTYGHATGDLVLADVAGHLSRSARAGDVVARWGGEEFLVILPDTGPEEVRAVGERLRAAVAAHPMDHATGPGSNPVFVTISIGTASANGHELRSLVADADAAMYEAKRTGRDRVTAAVRAADRSRQALSDLLMAAQVDDAPARQATAI